MRLFIGLALIDGVKDTVNGAVLRLCPVYRGDFTGKDNLHLTLKFLGEVQGSLLPRILEALQTAVLGQAAFSLRTSRLGSFKGKGGKTLWLGTEESAELQRLYEQVDSSLAAAGFAKETRPLKAHITLARRADISDKPDILASIPPVRIPVTAVTLFESLRINGVVTYRPLLAAKLEG